MANTVHDGVLTSSNADDSMMALSLGFMLIGTKKVDVIRSRFNKINTYSIDIHCCKGAREK